MSRNGNGDKEDAMARESNDLTPQSHFAPETRCGLSYGDVLDLIDLYKSDQETAVEIIFSGGYGESVKENAAHLLLIWMEANEVIETLKAFIEAERNRVEMEIWMEEQEEKTKHDDES